MTKHTFLISEIFESIQGEGPYAGYPKLFIRLAGCNLKCPYCDTKMKLKRKAVKKILFTEVVKRVEKSVFDIIITGGEPLLQKAAVFALVERFPDKSFEIETNGTIEITRKYRNVIWALDIKTPSSKGFFNEENLKHIRRRDWINFVITDKKDLDFAKKFVRSGKLKTDFIYFTPVYGDMDHGYLWEHIVKSEMKKVRLGFQLHKLIFGKKSEK